MKNNVAYTISKYGMTLCTLGMSAEFEKYKIAVNSLWPKTAIATAAIVSLMGNDAIKHCRKADIIADAAYAIITEDPSKLTGQMLLDENFLRLKGIKDFKKYACKHGEELYPDFYIDW